MADPNELASEAALLERVVTILESRFAHRVVELLPRAPGMARPFPSLWAADSKEARIGIVLRHRETLDDAGIARDVELIGLANAAAGGPQTYLFMIEGVDDAALESKITVMAEEKLGTAALNVLISFHEFGVPMPTPALDHTPASLKAVDRMLVERFLDDAALNDAGMYVGEVMVKAHGGKWDETEMGKGVMFPDESVVFPIAWVRKFARTKADADRITTKYEAIRKRLGP